MYHTILFDLDGTLTDPGLGITNSVMHALRAWGIEVSPDERASLYPFIGPPLTESFMKYFGFSPEDAVRAVDVYREYFSVKGLYENEVYPGVPALLSSLKADGKRVVLATSKPEVFAVKILDHFGLRPFFDEAVGSTLDGSLLRKADVIRCGLARLGVTDLSGVLMVGDREHDIMGAREVGIDSVGVTYGYGSRSELLSAGATYIAETPEEVLVYTRA